MLRQIEAIIQPPTYHWVGNGFRVHNFFPNNSVIGLQKMNHFIPPPLYHWVGNGYRIHNFFPVNLAIDFQRMSPFFLMDYGSKYEFPPSDIPRGVDVHPHRGIETVTVSYHGKIAHHDSVGNSGIISEGDIQWMTAGSGILHKEYLEKEFNKKGGTVQMVQLWVNLPAKHKMTEPKYQDLSYSSGSKYILPAGGGIIHVIAGEYGKIKGKANTFSPINLFDAALNKGAEIKFSFDENHNTGLLVIEGTVLINNEANVNHDHFVLFKNKDTDITLKAETNSKVLIMSGEPLNEPIAPYGPFVMNTREEIVQAYKDFKEGKFGHLE